MCVGGLCRKFHARSWQIIWASDGHLRRDLAAEKDLPGISPWDTVVQMTVLGQLECAIKGEQVVAFQRNGWGLESEPPPGLGVETLPSLG